MGYSEGYEGRMLSGMGWKSVILLLCVWCLVFMLICVCLACFVGVKRRQDRQTDR